MKRGIQGDDTLSDGILSGDIATDYSLGFYTVEELAELKQRDQVANRRFLVFFAFLFLLFVVCVLHRIALEGVVF